ncbi:MULTISPECIES: amidohydrolase family protein [Clostridium]|uniref:Amidohydrolase n=1 Tax=Clostridium ragsdalei P11 TaxID=1353534 RepID=A0A1A6AXP8_9CLOT|nr:MULTISPECIES: amidohydrolase family protein [Clostridium]OBR94856.1 amidohydrolase [Clostridium ragsdalei P11]
MKMIIDSHEHVILPTKKQIEMMDEAKVNLTILFATSIHPEGAKTVGEVKNGILALNNILVGNTNSLESRKIINKELASVVKNTPKRFKGFGSVPVGISEDETSYFIEDQIIRNNFIGIGEFTLASGCTNLLKTVFNSMNNFKPIPIWIHTFSPLTLSDIKGIANLAKLNPNIPVILGHMGGLNWLDTIEIAKEINNIYLDTSAVYATIALKLAVEALPERVLFSSDAPWGNPLASRTMVEAVIEDNGKKQLVLGENILSLM